MKHLLPWVVAAQGIVLLKLWWRGPNPERVALSLRVDRLADDIRGVYPAFARLNGRLATLKRGCQSSSNEPARRSLAVELVCILV
jgi:hypothetical protein